MTNAYKELCELVVMVFCLQRNIIKLSVDNGAACEVEGEVEGKWCCQVNYWGR